MGSTFADVASNGPLLLAIGAAALAGLISILSPCVLPLVPGYLSYVTGLAGADLDEALGVGTAEPPAAEGGVGVLTRAVRRRKRVLAGTLLFVAGFTVVYLLLAILVVRLRILVGAHQRLVDIVVGALVVVFGLVFLGLIPGLQRELRIHRLPAAGLLGAPVLGAVFAISWAPCIGPTLGAVLALAVTSGGVGRATILAVAYCLGLGIPFVVFGLAYRRLLGVFAAVRRNSRWVTRAGGALLIAMGVIMIVGGWNHVVVWLLTTFSFGADIGTSL